MDRCPLDGLEVDDLDAHARRAHNLTTDQIDDMVNAGLKALATRLETHAREQAGWTWDKAAGNLSIPDEELSIGFYL